MKLVYVIQWGYNDMWLDATDDSPYQNTLSFPHLEDAQAKLERIRTLSTSWRIIMRLEIVICE